MSSLENVPCLEVNLNNLQTSWDRIINSLSSCHFIAFDLEFSGIGAKTNFKIGNVEDRYTALAAVAKTRAILSVGISLFKYINNETFSTKKDAINEEENGGEKPWQLEQLWDFVADNYNVLVACKDDFVKEDDAVEFLTSHGFDFDRQASLGLPYNKGNDREEDDLYDVPSIRNLIVQIIQRKLPVVFHNGLLDILFLYQHLYSDLPNSLQTFIADLAEIFPCGIYDTKYLSEYQDKLPSSFLQYVFYERQRHNLHRILQKESFVRIHFTDYNEDEQCVEKRDMKTKILSDKPEGLKICQKFSHHGWCSNGFSCTKSHDIDYILDENKMSKKSKKGRRKQNAKMRSLKALSLLDDDSKCGDENSSDSRKIDDMETGQLQDEPEKRGAAGHSAGFDAFMTGFCFGVHLVSQSKTKLSPSERFTPTKIGMKGVANMLYLTGKDLPLKVVRSSYSSPSTHHKKKILKIRSKSTV